MSGKMKKVWVKGSVGWHKIHPWIYRKNVKRIDPDLEGGEYCAVYHEKGGFIGSAIYNPKTNIALRFYSRKEEPLEYQTIKLSIERALFYRKRYLPDEDSFRVVFGESDSLPGLVIDKYNKGIVFQIHSLGFERRRGDVIDAITDLFDPEFIVEKSNSHARREEGLERRNEVVFGDPPEELVITQSGFKYIVDVKEGQKTGFYFDQRDNRKKVAQYAQNAEKALDLFSYTGGFTLHLLNRGVKKVYAVDQSERALELLIKNLELNGFDRERVITFEKDVFDFLDEMILANESFDLIVIDPPAFAKGKKGVEGALKGYTILHDRAIRLLKRGGIIATFTCSQVISEEDLMLTLTKASQKLERHFYIMERLGQPVDHPILLGFPQSHYLKGFIVREVIF